jgi:CheY-like chemotaxis protein
VKFTGQGEVSLSVDLIRSDSGETRLHAVVRDTGIGIPPDRVDRLFQSFSQVDSSTTRTHGGTGLGLAISRRLIELMGGRIWAESHVGQGSRFHLELPLVRPTSDLAPEITAPAAPSIGARKILVVDDNATSRDILELHLVQWGARPECVASPVEALERISHGERFDAVLVDQLMPGMNGVQFTRELRSIAGAELPVILLTQLGQRNVTFADGPFVGLLPKPIRPHQLMRALRQVFDSSVRTEPLESTSNYWPLLGFMRVLVVEDNPVNQRVARALLERVSIRPDIASHGGEALDALARQPYDIVIMDVQMPVMNGLDATREIRRRVPADRQPVIIAMTASAMAKHRETCLEAGMDDYISKPVRAEVLYARLDHWQKLRAERNDGVFTPEGV